MDTIAELNVPAEKFALKQTLLVAPETSFEAERITAHGSDRVLPLMWATGGDLDTLETTLRNDPSTEEVELLTNLDNEQLYSMEWVKDIRFLVYILVEEDAAILSASGTDEYWQFRILFPHHDALSDTYDFCESWNLGVTIQSVHQMKTDRHGRSKLTKAQTDVLVLALSRGYYDIPRTVETTDLADELGISQQAVSERLRRAHEKVARESVIIGHEADATRKMGSK